MHKAVDDSTRFHEQRTGDDGLKRIETRIANANAEVEQITNAHILGFFSELVKGDTVDKAYLKKIIDRLVYKVFVSDRSFLRMSISLT